MVTGGVFNMQGNEQQDYYKLIELAKRYNLSKSGVRKIILSKEYHDYVSHKMIKGHNTIVVSKDILPLLDKRYQKMNSGNNYNNEHSNEHSTQSNDSNNSNEHVKHSNEYSESYQELKQMIKFLQEENKNLHLELQHEQELHLSDQNHVKQLEEQVKDLKTDLNLENKDYPIKEDKENDSDTKQTKNKKWWQFWK